MLIRLAPLVVLCSLVATCATFAVPGSAQAKSLVWDGSLDSSFTSAANWVEVGFPGVDVAPSNGDALTVPAGVLPNYPVISNDIAPASLALHNRIALDSGIFEPGTLTLHDGAAITQSGGGMRIATSVSASAGTKTWNTVRGGIEFPSSADLGTTTLTLGGDLNDMDQPQVTLSGPLSVAQLVWREGIMLNFGGPLQFVGAHVTIYTRASPGSPMVLGSGSRMTIPNGEDLTIANGDLTLAGGVVETLGDAAIDTYYGGEPWLEPSEVVVTSGSVVPPGATLRLANSYLRFANAVGDVASGSRIIANNSPVTLDVDVRFGADARLDLQGTASLRPIAGQRLIHGGAITWPGTASLNEGDNSLLGLRDGATLEATGTGSYGFGKPTTIGASSTLLASMDGAAVISGAFGLDPSATIRVLDDADVALPGLARYDGVAQSLTGGTYETQGDGKLRFAGPITSLTGSSTALVVGSTGSFVDNAGADALRGLTSVTGVLTVRPGAVLSTSRQLAVLGRLVVDGTVKVDDGNAATTDELHLGAAATLAGDGIVQGSVDANVGTLEPIGSLAVTGNLAMGSAALTKVALATAHAAPILDVTGDVKLDGAVSFDTTGYDLDFTDSFALAAAGGELTGDFATRGPIGAFGVARLVIDAAADTARLEVTETTPPSAVPVVDLLGANQSNNTRPTVVFTTGADAPNGSGIDTARYSVSFSQVANDLPDTVAETIVDQRFQSPVALADGVWFAHVRNVDREGNWSLTAGHSAAFTIDTTVPMTPEPEPTKPAPVTPGPVAPAPVTPSPVTPGPVTPTPTSPAPPKPTALADRLTGSGIRDILNGLGGNDVLRGLGGNDLLKGGAGNDKLDGGAGNDVLDGGPGKDTVAGAAGNDTITVRDGARDVVTCGPGKDAVVADRLDKVAGDCEKVTRR